MLGTLKEFYIKKIKAPLQAKWRKSWWPKLKEKSANIFIRGLLRLVVTPFYAISVNRMVKRELYSKNSNKLSVSKENRKPQQKKFDNNTTKFPTPSVRTCGIAG